MTLFSIAGGIWPYAQGRYYLLPTFVCFSPLFGDSIKTNRKKNRQAPVLKAQLSALSGVAGKRTGNYGMPPRTPIFELAIADTKAKKSTDVKSKGKGVLEQTSSSNSIVIYLQNFPLNVPATRLFLEPHDKSENNPLAHVFDRYLKWMTLQVKCGT